MYEFSGMPFRDEGSSEIQTIVVIGGGNKRKHIRERYPSIPFTDALIKALPPPKHETWMRDSECPALFLRVRHTGAKTWYQRQRRVKARYPWEADEDARREIIGKVADYTIEEARRKIALRQRSIELKVARPKKMRRDTRLCDVFAEFERQFPSVTTDWFANRNNLIKQYPVARYGERFLSGITAAQWETLVETASLANHSRGIHLLKAAKSFLNWAIRSGLLKANPLAGAKFSDPLSLPARCCLPADEILDIFYAAQKLGPPWDAILGVTILTGEALEDVRQIQRGDIDLDRSQWTVGWMDASRFGSHSGRIVHLTERARNLLAPYREQRAFLFPSPNKLRDTPVHFSTERLEQLREISGLMKNWGIRDLRRSVVCELGSTNAKRAHQESWDIRLKAIEAARAQSLDEVVL